ncbi:MAG: hypothetical protein NWQ28_12920 [Nodularia sp. (in: cyanobacteria)]|nr:hypothetical protein [Nodularia sp. (in: cyanobacteria)]
MGVFNKINETFQESRQLLKKSLEEYISFSNEAKQLTLKRKMVLRLCQQAESRIEQLTSLEPDDEEGLIAKILYNNIQVKLHFTPEKITLEEDSITGELRLLNSPEFETESIVYRYLIAGWKIFLGGKIPDGNLPKEVRIEKDKVYYTLPRNQLQLVDALFHNLENGSNLMTSLKQGDLTIKTSVALNWKNFKFQNMLKFLKLK